jgi:4'-phosphopantetheinyl transferase EntD
MPWPVVAPCAPHAVPDLNALSDALRGVLGPGFGVGVTDPRVASDPLWDEERPAIARAVPKRILEFTAGRTAARAAMADIGLAPAAIPMGHDRAPIWPDGIIGSIAHCDTACIAAVAHTSTAQSVGLDIEEATPLTTDLWDTVCTPSELAWLATQPEDQQSLLVKRIFVAKEAVYKAQYPFTKRMIGFKDVEVALSNASFIAHLNEETAKGQMITTPNLILGCLCFT